MRLESWASMERRGFLVQLLSRPLRHSPQIPCKTLARGQQWAYPCPSEANTSTHRTLNRKFKSEDCGVQNFRVGALKGFQCGFKGFQMKGSRFSVCVCSWRWKWLKLSGFCCQVSTRDVWLSGLGMKFLFGTCQFRAGGVRMMVSSVRGFILRAVSAQGFASGSFFLAFLTELKCIFALA